MFLVVGLGNPGKEYEKTRHNVGFNVIDLLSNKYNINLNRKKFRGEYGNGILEGEKVLLLKPQTYMNLSGESVNEAVNFYKIPNNKIIIIYDDISLDIGKIRIRPKGSAGGHNGIKSIISNLSSDQFIRIKVGVGGPNGDLVSHVLGRFQNKDKENIEKVFEVVLNAVETIIKHGVSEAMNRFNGVYID
ncbi:aminoacyl-tRNA hydrolase [Haloimpatiens sp. FM7330]|uniref:aminoacyl-tRNA hydrolase n=1 Tax=Haloimpatiens sp. FM7330 TaxID=3298610 RepID=UPI0036441CD9